MRQRGVIGDAIKSEHCYFNEHYRTLNKRQYVHPFMLIGISAALALFGLYFFY